MLYFGPFGLGAGGAGSPYEAQLVARYHQGGVNGQVVDVLLAVLAEYRNPGGVEHRVFGLHEAYNERNLSGYRVAFLLNGDVLDNIAELQFTLDLGDDELGERVPFGNFSPLLNLGPVVHQQVGAVGYRVPFEDASGLLILYVDLSLLGGHYLAPLAVDYVFDVVVTEYSVVLHHERALNLLGGSRTTDVERSHGELGTGLTYRLGRDDTDRFADRYQLAVGQVHSVTFGANAPFGLAG